MNKRFRIMVLIMGSVIALSGCGNEAGNQEKSTINTIEQSTKAGDNTLETNTQSSEGSLKILTGSGMDYNTEEGRYYINTEDGESDGKYSTIRYIDYQAKKEVYLCNKLNCKHDNKDCTAVIWNQDSFVDSFLFGDEKYVYILVTPYDSDGSAMTEIENSGVEEGILSVSNGSDEPPTIYRMNKDGSNREKVFAFKSGMIAEQNVIGDGRYLYVVTKRLNSETKENTTYTSGYDRKLVRLDLEKGTLEDVVDLKNEQTIIGCSGRNLIVSENDFGREISNEERQDDDKYKKLYEKSKDIISSINIDSKEVTELKSIKNSNEKLHSEMVYGDKLYTTYEGQKCMEITDLKSGETKKRKLNDSYMIDNIISIKNEPGVIVGKLYSVMGKEDKKGWSEYFIDTETGEVTKSTLQTRYHTPITIEGENEEYLYVQSNYKNATEYVAWVGVNQEYISEVEYSIISKKDYLANRADYQKVELLNGGKLNN